MNSGSRRNSISNLAMTAGALVALSASGYFFWNAVHNKIRPLEKPPEKYAEIAKNSTSPNFSAQAVQVTPAPQPAPTPSFVQASQIVSPPAVSLVSEPKAVAKEISQKKPVKKSSKNTKIKHHEVVVKYAAPSAPVIAETDPETQAKKDFADITELLRKQFFTALREAPEVNTHLSQSSNKKTILQSTRESNAQLDVEDEEEDGEEGAPSTSASQEALDTTRWVASAPARQEYPPNIQEVDVPLQPIVFHKSVLNAADANQKTVNLDIQRVFKNAPLARDAIVIKQAAPDENQPPEQTSPPAETAAKDTASSPNKSKNSEPQEAAVQPPPTAQLTGAGTFEEQHEQPIKLNTQETAPKTTGEMTTQLGIPQAKQMNTQNPPQRMPAWTPYHPPVPF